MLHTQGKCHVYLWFICMGYKWNKRIWKNERKEMQIWVVIFPVIPPREYTVKIFFFIFISFVLLLLAIFLSPFFHDTEIQKIIFKCCSFLTLSVTGYRSLEEQEGILVYSAYIQNHLPIRGIFRIAWKFIPKEAKGGK